MFQKLMPLSLGGGVDLTNPTQVYSLSSGEGEIIGSNVSVTKGKYYVISGVTQSNGRNNVYSITGGELLGTFLPAADVHFGNYDLICPTLIVYATEDTIRINASGSYPYLFASQIIQLDS